MTKSPRQLLRRHVLAAGFAAAAAPALAAMSAGRPEGLGRWRVGPDLPEPVQEIYPAFWRDRIHLAGGFIAKTGRIAGPTARHVVLEKGAKAWVDKAPLPAPRHHPNLVGLGDRLYAVGGFASPAADAVWTMQASLFVYDPASDAWMSGPDAPAPNAETVAAALGERLHVVGGRRPTADSNAVWTDHADVADHYVYDPAAKAWSRAAPAVTARNSAAGAVLAGRLHVVGGRTVVGGNQTAHEVYDPAEDRWRTAAPMPQGQGGLAAAALQGRLVAFGGEWFGPAGGGVYAQAWVYDPARDAWEAAAPMPTPRHGLGAAAWGEEAYVIGGAARQGGNDTSARVEIFSLA